MEKNTFPCGPITNPIFALFNFKSKFQSNEWKLIRLRQAHPKVALYRPTHKLMDASTRAQ